MALGVGRKTSVRAVWLRPRREAACEKTAMGSCLLLRALNLQQQQCDADDLIQRSGAVQQQPPD